MRATKLLSVGLLLTVTVLAGGCAKDDGASVRNGGSGSSSVSGSSSAAAGCTPVGEKLASKADTTVDVTLDDYSFDLSETTVPAGVIHFEVTNAGKHDHELAFLPGGGDVPLTEDGHADETALEKAGAFEMEAIAPGTDCSATWKLKAGTYTVFCVIETGGKTHVAKGMQAEFTVT